MQIEAAPASRAAAERLAAGAVRAWVLAVVALLTTTAALGAEWRATYPALGVRLPPIVRWQQAVATAPGVAVGCLLLGASVLPRRRLRPWDRVLLYGTGATVATLILAWGCALWRLPLLHC